MDDFLICREVVSYSSDVDFYRRQETAEFAIIPLKERGAYFRFLGEENTRPFFLTDDRVYERLSDECYAFAQLCDIGERNADYEVKLSFRVWFVDGELPVNDGKAPSLKQVFCKEGEELIRQRGFFLSQFRELIRNNLHHCSTLTARFLKYVRDIYLDVLVRSPRGYLGYENSPYNGFQEVGEYEAVLALQRKCQKEYRELKDWYGNDIKVDFIDLLGFRIKNLLNVGEAAFRWDRLAEVLCMFYDNSKPFDSEAFPYRKKAVALSVELVILSLERARIEADDKHRREMEREEQKAQREYEAERRRAERDAEAARKSLEKAQAKLEKARAQEQVDALRTKIAELQEALRLAEDRRFRAISMAEQTRMGYVYVISNPESFGEGVFKIGLTRRLDPMERVRELGDASVPFPFRVHAFIFSNDAPALEHSLHQRFASFRMNPYNFYKEFFRVPLDDIRQEVTRLGYDVCWEEVDG